LSLNIDRKSFSGFASASDCYKVKRVFNRLPASVLISTLLKKKIIQSFALND
jgi:hypothetical protein